MVEAHTAARGDEIRAFLPQLVDPQAGAPWTQVLALGAILAVLGLASDVLYALVAGCGGSWLRRVRLDFKRS